MDCSAPQPAGETCNSMDDDCDGAADEGLLFQIWYLDYDQDGVGSDPVSGCSVSAPWRSTAAAGQLSRSTRT